VRGLGSRGETEPFIEPLRWAPVQYAEPHGRPRFARFGNETSNELTAQASPLKLREKLNLDQIPVRAVARSK
jgi:hypothetical protein